MPKTLSPLAEAYVRLTNEQDAAGFLALFADDAVVDDNGREFRGSEAIAEWSRREIFAADVTLEVLDEFPADGATVVRTKVDGTFDRTGLPDPVIIDQRIVAAGGKIAELTCRLAT